jgi:hypothetical protein
MRVRSTNNLVRSIWYKSRRSTHVALVTGEWSPDEEIYDKAFFFRAGVASKAFIYRFQLEHMFSDTDHFPVGSILSPGAPMWWELDAFYGRGSRDK